MSEHKTTFNYIQYGNVRRATLRCDTCYLTMEIDCLKMSTRVAEAAFWQLHQKEKPQTLKSEQVEIRKEIKKRKKKKSKKAKIEITKLESTKEGDEDFTATIEDPQLPEGYQ